MKTTVELPDALLQQAKALALRRRTTLKAVLTRALERELRGDAKPVDAQRFEVDAGGWPILKREDTSCVVRDEMIRDLRDQEGV